MFTYVNVELYTIYELYMCIHVHILYLDSPEDMKHEIRTESFINISQKAHRSKR